MVNKVSFEPSWLIDKEKKYAKSHPVLQVPSQEPSMSFKSHTIYIIFEYSLRVYLSVCNQKCYRQNFRIILLCSVKMIYDI